jgi:hypothetical protein
MALRPPPRQSRSRSTASGCSWRADRHPRRHPGQTHLVFAAWRPAGPWVARSPHGHRRCHARRGGHAGRADRQAAHTALSRSHRHNRRRYQTPIKVRTGQPHPGANPLSNCCVGGCGSPNAVMPQPWQPIAESGSVTDQGGSLRSPRSGPVLALWSCGDDRAKQIGEDGCRVLAGQLMVAWRRGG